MRYQAEMYGIRRKCAVSSRNIRYQAERLNTARVESDNRKKAATDPRNNSGKSVCRLFAVKARLTAGIDNTFG